MDLLHNYIFFDSHVHLYNRNSIDLLCDTAYRNLINYSNKYQCKSRALVLLIAERDKSDSFKFLQELAINNKKIGDWVFNQTNEKNSVLTKNSFDETLIFISGSQIVTAENIEVLALGSNPKINRGISLIDLLNNIHKLDAIPILPWGFAKWWGKRGKVISYLMDNSNIYFFLGDNGGRTKVLPSSLLNRAKNTSIKILSGTDPLPLPDEIKRIGSYGSVLKGELSYNNPCQDLINLLKKDNISIETFGKLLSPFQFFLNQFYLRLKKFS